MSLFLDVFRVREFEEELLLVVDEYGIRGGCGRSKVYW